MKRSDGHGYIRDKLFQIARDFPDIEVTVIVVDKRSRETLADSTGESATVILSIVSLYKLLAATGVHTIASINNMVNKALNLTHE